MTEDGRTVTRVEIAGDEYTIRTEASAEYARECARYVDQTIREIMSRGGLVEPHKAAILAALALADELFQAREDATSLRQGVTERAARMQAEIEEKMATSGLASAD